MITLSVGDKWYHSSYNFKGIQSDKLIFLSKNPNYSRYTIEWLLNHVSKKIVDGCCSYDLNSPVYEFTLTKNIVLQNVVNETLINYFTEYYDINLYCNLQNIDGLYTPRGYNFQNVMCVYVRDTSMFSIRELQNYNENVPVLYKTIATFDMIWKLLEILLTVVPSYRVYNNISTRTKDFNTKRIKSMKKDFYEKNKNPSPTIQFLNSVNDIKVMSYNVHDFTDVYNKCTKRGILDMINTINPDICCLQEAIYLKTADLVNYNIIKTFNNVVAIKKEHTIVCRSEYSLPGCLDSYRWLQHVCVNINGNIYNIFNTHLDPWDLSGKKKYKQFEFVLDIINKKACKNYILLGDFNDINMDDYSQDKITYMRKYENRFISKYNFNSLIQPEILIDIFKGVSYSCWTDKRVDYILCSSDIYKKYINKYTISTNQSDHLPMIIVLKR